VANSESSRRVALQNLVLHDPTRSSQQQTGTILLQATRGIHAGLWLDKYIASLESFKAGSQDKANGSPQQQLVKEVAGLQVPELYISLYKRWKAHLEAVGAIPREFVVRGRMAVGLGNESVLETSVALHRTYGVPYIPGSALKRLAASYARQMAGEDWQPDSIAYKTVFGETENAGYVTFFDALYIPIKERQNPPAQSGNRPDCPLRRDIITAHHPAYYQNKKDEKGQPAPPADWDSPNPVPFLSATGSYLIALATPDLDPTWIEKTFEILAEALLILGIGAKTWSRYGRRKMFEPVTEVLPSEMEAVAGLIHEISNVKDVPSQMQGYYQRWKLLKTEAAQKRVAQAIIEKITEAHREKWASVRVWYQDLQAFLIKSQS